MPVPMGASLEAPFLLIFIKFLNYQHSSLYSINREGSKVARD